MRRKPSHPLPHRYEIITFLGEGVSAVVLKCFDSHTKENVAVKLAKGKYKLNHEAAMMQFLMKHNLDKKNIIKFHNSFSLNSCLVFEMCDVSLKDYLKQKNTPLDLEDIRTVIQQLATALDALKKFGIIHSDIKTNNIMVVDPKRKPLEVKLIDYGRALFTYQANQTINQCLSYKAPELILGLPYSAALDIWSLGCVMAKMLLNCAIFTGKSEYENLCSFVDLLGPPPDHLVDAGSQSAEFFKKTDSNHWRLKAPVEYWGEERPKNIRSFITRFLHQAKMSHLKFEELAVPDERKECISLLKAMLQWDAEKRITPKGILNHCFIRNNDNTSSSFHESITVLGQEPNTSKEAGFATAMACPTGTSQGRQVVKGIVNFHLGSRRTYDIADQPKDFDKSLPPLPKTKQPPCEHLDQPAPIETRFLFKNRDDVKPTTGTSSKSTIKQDEQDPSVYVEPATTKEDYSQKTKNCSKPKRKKNFLKNICLCWGRS